MEPRGQRNRKVFELSSTSRTNSGYNGGENTFRACKPDPGGRSQREIYAQETVLVKEGAYRNDWPIGRVSEAIASDDGQVRKAQVEVLRGGTTKMFLRPINELVLLVAALCQRRS